MPFDPPPAPRSLARPRWRIKVAAWLFGLCAMVWVMVVLGGATRLTGSGLSIMEWAPVSGVLPPLSHAEWQRLFGLYQNIPQFRLLHPDMDLAGFQRHLLARMGASPVGPADRAGADPAAGLFRLARRHRPPPRPATGGLVCAGRHAGRGRLVHGRLRFRRGHPVRVRRPAGGAFAPGAWRCMQGCCGPRCQCCGRDPLAGAGKHSTACSGCWRRAWR